MGRQQAYPMKSTKTCRHCGKESEVILYKSGQRNTHHFCDDKCRSGMKMAKNAAMALTVGKVHKPPKPRDGTCGVVSLAKEKEKVQADQEKTRSETDKRNDDYREMLRQQRSRR